MIEWKSLRIPCFKKQGIYSTEKIPFSNILLTKNWLQSISNLQLRIDMHLELTPEALLTQLGYTKTEQTLNQMNNIIKNTRNFKSFSPHIPSFCDALAVEKGFIAMSNSQDYLKIKCNEDLSADNLSAFRTLVNHWADKYKLELKLVENKNTYYILGQN